MIDKKNDWPQFIVAWRTKNGRNQWEAVSREKFGPFVYWLDSVTPTQRELLNGLVQKVVFMWLGQINEKPTFYKVLPCEECTLKEALEIHNEKVANMSRGGKIDV